MRLTLHTELSSRTLTTLTLLQHHTRQHAQLREGPVCVQCSTIQAASSLTEDAVLHGFIHSLFGDNIFTDRASRVF